MRAGQAKDKRADCRGHGDSGEEGGGELEVSAGCWVLVVMVLLLVLMVLLLLLAWHVLSCGALRRAHLQLHGLGLDPRLLRVLWQCRAGQGKGRGLHMADMASQCYCNVFIIPDCRSIARIRCADCQMEGRKIAVALRHAAGGREGRGRGKRERQR